MNPSELIKLFLTDYISTHGLSVAIEPPEGAQEPPSEWRMVPHEPGAAGLAILVLTFAGEEYGVFVFIEDDESPIELVGPINVTRPERRPILEDLADVLDSVANGEACREFDENGNFLGCNILDPERTANDPHVARREMFKAWS